MFCTHDWAPRTGMDSGSSCMLCGRVSAKECLPGSGLSSGELLPRSASRIDPAIPTPVSPRSFFDRLLGSYPTR